MIYWGRKMDYEFNPKTAALLGQLSAGSIIELGGNEIGPLDPDEIRLLNILIDGYSGFEGSTGATLLELFIGKYRTVIQKETEEIKETALEDKKDTTDQEVTKRDDNKSEGTVSISKPKRYKIGKLQSYSFKGLAAAEVKWEFDFNKSSQLIYGPNGSGKSCLLGAISWCLSGKIFRDGGAPSEPEMVKSFTTTGTIRAARNRSEALSLVSLEGANADENLDFWVALELITEDTVIWLKRNSSSQLEKSDDGLNWSSIEKIEDIGINPIDVELKIIMPARVPHIKFGKEVDLFQVFSQIIGLNDLEIFSSTAGKLQSACTRDANATDKEINGDIKNSISEIISRVDENSGEIVKNLTTYNEAVNVSRDSKKTKDLLGSIDELLSEENAKLADDLGINIPVNKAPEYRDFKKLLENLPGQVSSAIENISIPTRDCFPSLYDGEFFDTESPDELNKIIDGIENEAIEIFNETADFLEKTKIEEKLPLILAAAKHFSGEDCPLCEQSLMDRPEIKTQLNDAIPLLEKDYLNKEINDSLLALKKKLDDVVSNHKRGLSKTDLSERLKNDWENKKTACFPDLLLSIAAKFDPNMVIISDKLNINDNEVSYKNLLNENNESYSTEQIKEFESCIVQARIFLNMRAQLNTQGEEIEKGLRSILGSDDEVESDSLKALLSSGDKAIRSINEVAVVKSDVILLDREQRDKEEQEGKVTLYRKICEDLGKVKGLGDYVRKEIGLTVSSVETETIDNYRALYTDNVFNLSTVTAGHAANTSIKDELGVYFESFNEQLPVFPYSNSGRIRGLAVSFVFALIKQSKDSLDTYIFDDPAISFDDEHKIRFVKHFIEPLLDNEQVILATHYEDFYKKSEEIFNDHEKLQIIPKISMVDSVAFEPSDLLQRVSTALSERSCSWREASVNQRRWVERTFSTISAYCPEPFFDGSNLHENVTAYSRISDPQIATTPRDKIVSILTLDFVRDVHRNAHDESITQSEVEDKQKVLLTSRVLVDAEIKKFKGLYKHKLTGKNIASKPLVKILNFPNKHQKVDVLIEDSAAAAQLGTGVSDKEYGSLKLDEFPLAIAKANTLNPIIFSGQLLILDPNDSVAKNGDLVVFIDENSNRYLRRFWDSDGIIQLEATNSTNAIAPFQCKKGENFSRRIVGTFFQNFDGASSGDEWVDYLPAKNLMDNLRALKVIGTSLEPIARNGQYILVHKDKLLSKPSNGMLICAALRDEGNVIKRIYEKDSNYILMPVNQNILEEPILVKKEDVLQIYEVQGVLFESGIEP